MHALQVQQTPEQMWKECSVPVQMICWRAEKILNTFNDILVSDDLFEIADDAAEGKIPGVTVAAMNELAVQQVLHYAAAYEWRVVQTTTRFSIRAVL